VWKEADGAVHSIELAGLADDLQPAFVDVDGVVPGGLLEPEDGEDVGRRLAPGTSAAVLVWENTWAVPFITAMQRAGAMVVDHARLDADAVQSVLESQ
jgi:hypothetical protein